MADRIDRVGQQVGEYRLLRWLGGGNFGDVYLGEHMRTQSQAAVKILQTRLTHGEELKQFINEARTFRLRHPHIVQLLDFGIGNDDVPFLVMEYAPHGTLREKHPKGSQLSLSTITSYVTPLASALQYAHDLQLIHRDVKPENILLGSRDEVLLSDFGITAIAHSSRTMATQEGVGGTLPYMAPEQTQGKPRPASDQYALGIVVYEWITGTRPFTGTAMEIAMQHSLAPIPPLRGYVSALSPDVEHVVLTALAKDPRQRFPHIQVFAVALEAACLHAHNASSSPTFIMPALPPRPLENSFPTFIVPPRPPEVPYPQADSFAKPASSPSPPVLMPRSPVTPPGAEAFKHIAQGVASPAVPVSKSTSLSLQRQTMPRSNYWNKFFRGKTAVLIGLVLLIIAGSAGIAFTLISHPPLTAAQATATAHTQITATVTAAANAYATYVLTHGIMFGFDAQHTHGNPYEQILNAKTVSGLTKQWAINPGSTLYSSPAVVNGVVYVGSENGNLYAIDAASGGKKWAYHTGNRIESSPAVVNGVVYVGSYDGNLYAINAISGSKKWAYTTGSSIFSSPAIVNGVAYVGSADGNLYAIDAASGSKKWAYTTRGPIVSSPAIVNGVVYVGSDDGNLHAIDAASGSKKWAFPTGDIISSSPAVVNGVVYASSLDSKLYAIDATSGSKKWAYTTGSSIESSPAVVNGVVYVGSRDRNLYAFDATSGSKKWAYTTGSSIYSSPTIANGVVYVGSRDGNLYAFDLSVPPA